MTFDRDKAIDILEKKIDDSLDYEDMDDDELVETLAKSSKCPKNFGLLNSRSKACRDTWCVECWSVALSN